MNKQQSCTKRHKVTDLTYKSIKHLVEHGSQTPPVNCAVVCLLLENLGGQILWGKQQERVNTCLTIITCPWWSFCIKNEDVWVSLEICFVPQASRRRLLWYHWPQDLLCRGQSLWGQCGPVSPTGCSQASGPCGRWRRKLLQKWLKVTPVHVVLQFSSCLQMSTRGQCRIAHYLYTMCREWR